MADGFALRAQLEIRDESGRTQRIVSDTGWKITAGPCLHRTSMAAKRTTPRRGRELSGWSSAPYDDREWASGCSRRSASLRARGVALATGASRARATAGGYPSVAPSGETIFDLGQNFTGWARLSVRGPAGTTVTFGSAKCSTGRAISTLPTCVRPLKRTGTHSAGTVGKCTSRTSRSMAFAMWPWRDFPRRPIPPRSRASRCRPISHRRGVLVTSDSLLNQLQRNIVWGQRSNFLDVPTDCPQRDERLGWTGDAQCSRGRPRSTWTSSGFFAKVAIGCSGRSGSERQRSVVIPNPLGGDSTRFAGTAGWVRCRRHRSLDDVPHLWRPALARTPVSEHARVGRLRAAPSRHRPDLETGMAVRRLAGAAQRRSVISRRDDGHGPDRNSVPGPTPPIWCRARRRYSGAPPTRLYIGTLQRDT